MQVYLVRHGVAEERRPDRPDEDRALTGPGRKKTKRATRGLRRLGVELDLVLTSPLVRAAQTAKIVARRLGGRRIPEPSLAPGGTPQRVAERIAREAPGSRLALVGHQPELGELLSFLAFGTGREVPLGKAGVARIDFDGRVEAGSGELVWLLDATVLERVCD